MGNRTTVVQAASTLIRNAAGKYLHWSNVFERDAKFISVTDRVHRETHEGEGFLVCHIFAGIDDDAHADILIQTGAEKELHLTFSPTAGGEAFAYLYEDTGATGGTVLTPRNRLRSSSETSDAIFAYGPSADSVVGTLISCSLIPGGFGGNSVGSTGTSDREEIVLKINTNYLVRVTNKAAQTKNISNVCSWYEEPPL